MQAVEVVVFQVRSRSQVNGSWRWVWWREIFGFEVTAFSNDDLRDREPSIESWPNNAVMWSLTPTQENDLGLSVSRPTFAHVNFDGQIKGVAIVGCGLDHVVENNNRARHGQVGRCLLFLDVNTGQVLHKVVGPDSAEGLRYPVVGSPTVYPNDGNAEVVYFGDRRSGLFRLNLSGSGLIMAVRENMILSKYSRQTK